MGQLSKLPNIGKTLEEKLNQIDIITKEELFTLGSKESFKRIRGIDKDACFNMLCALEGAVQGIRWHNLSKEIKKDLNDFLKYIENGK
ncbi:TfoX/Sxy family protein [Wukongibacter baidiensis]|uniref:TfoX/Sxy family protein n=1 Tax=Wukongibacter baidiensis TaxID=1723361 RepID=UPI003D7F283B